MEFARNCLVPGLFPQQLSVLEESARVEIVEVLEVSVEIEDSLKKELAVVDENRPRVLGAYGRVGRVALVRRVGDLLRR